MIAASSAEELEKLADELRKTIIDVCSTNGGHIGASLGAVELTVALHAEFNTPEDSIVWDVGHQSYAHKLLTRPREEFKRLRKKDGPSGFTSRAESSHDAFGAGHSSTSISAALGIAEAKRLQGDSSWTVAAIGDGGLTAGLAFEALNQAGASEASRLLIIVNDNNLSISANVGALNRWAFGAEREPNKFFESLGFSYVGPIDGHDIEAIRKTIKGIKDARHSKVHVLHVLTKKGKGFLPAEIEPVKFHGVGPFDKLTGLSGVKASEPTYSAVFGKAALELAKKDSALVAITAAMAEGTGLVEFSEKFPSRFYDVGIAEPHALVFAAGLAARGVRPVVSIYSTFLQRAIDSIVHDIALQGLNVVLAVDRAGLVGADGPTHHGLFDIPMLRTVPHISIAAPACAEDLIGLLELAVKKPGLKAIRFPRGAAPTNNAAAPIEWGRGQLRHAAKRPKDHLVVWAFGAGVTWAEEAWDKLAENVKDQVSIVDARFAKPLDSELLAQTLAGARCLMTIEDGSIAGGFGSAVLEEAVARRLSLPPVIELKGIPDRFIKHAEISEQRVDIGLSAEQLATRMMEILSK